MNWWNRLTTTVRLGIVVGLLATTIGAIYLYQSRRRAEPISQNGQVSPIYHCPMHPAIVSDKPGTCPICGMDLQLIESHGERIAQNEEQITSPVEGRAEFQLSAERQQIIGVSYVKVMKEQVSKSIEVTGRVAFDPELYTAIEEYRQAIASRMDLKDSSFGNIKTQSDALVHSAKTRLSLLGLSETQIAKISRSNEDPISLILPKGKAWIYAEVFESEAGNLKQGQQIEAKSPAATGQTFKGKISSISRVISQPTRTIRIQAEVDDSSNILRADTYLNVMIRVELGEGLAIPEQAVLYSKNSAYVFVRSGKDMFVPRIITIGEKTADKYIVLSGLNEGEEVVRSANFLLDSEARLRSVIDKAR